MKEAALLAICVIFVSCAGKNDNPANENGFDSAADFQTADAAGDSINTDSISITEVEPEAFEDVSEQTSQEIIDIFDEKISDAELDDMDVGFEIIDIKDAQQDQLNEDFLENDSLEDICESEMTEIHINDVEFDLCQQPRLVTVSSSIGDAAFTVDDDEYVYTATAYIELCDGDHILHFHDQNECVQDKDELITVSEFDTEFNIDLVPITFIGSFTSEPQGAMVAEDGQIVCGVTPCADVEQNACDHSYLFSLADYQDQIVNIDLSYNNFNVHAEMMQNPPVTLIVETDPIGAIVTLNGQIAFCHTPCAEPVESGQHYTIIVNKYGYAPIVWNEMVDENNHTFSASMEEPELDFAVTIDSDPQGVPFKIDGQSVSNTMDYVVLMGGPHIFEFGGLPSCYSYVSLLEFIEYDAYLVYTEVEQYPTVNFSSSPEGAAVILNENLPDEFQAETPFSQCLPPGAYSVRCQLSGYDDLVFDINITSQQSQDFECHFQ